ncbi:hypothetical protein [Hymenobacter persicinus]|uniref:Uncharacterized protein n=1 Tax=Hymenobacter persicinus TaxID=2025506 RepID=A0A4Q5LBU1_9BACT|nr:hypothetical protein [Hymenobacter persicinus]RYU79561.1 hypothetical protein EWM57_10365 [Hymenobacter persicinus]
MLPLLKQTSLTEAGFAPLGASQPIAYVSFNQPAAYIPASEIRYVHACQAQDGARLYVYSWLDAPGYLLTTQPRITSLSHIFAELDTDDPQELQTAVDAFFHQHGGAYSYPAIGCN